MSADRLAALRLAEQMDTEDAAPAAERPWLAAVLTIGLTTFAVLVVASVAVATGLV
jgi:hypothetical protein